MDSEIIWNFIKKYYINSIIYKEGYNVVNTLTWAVILIFMVWIIYRFLENRLPIDKTFLFSTIPYVIFGSSIRIIEDAGFLDPPISYFFMTPLIYVIVFLICFPTLVISIKTYKREYYKPYATFGSVLTIISVVLIFSNLEIRNLWVIPLGFALSLLLTLVFYCIVPYCRNAFSILVFFSHMFDGIETYIGTKYLGYIEIHVIPRILIENLGPISLPLAKFFVFLGVLYIIDTSKEPEKLKNYLKLILIVLGLAPGLRDGLRMTFGV